ncbi:MAG: zinc-ribbon domain-containing protein, partial [Clostridia bacterium]|nr:zinc-ribbon domain-containing protein [Clostridia bacterium]
MKFCRNCGSPMEDEAAVCANCGSYTETYSTKAETAMSTEASTLQTIAKVFMIIGCVASAVYILIPWCWT